MNWLLTVGICLNLASHCSRACPEAPSPGSICSSWRLSEFALNVPVRVLEMGELLYGVAFDVLREHCYPDLRVRLGTVTFSI